VGSFSIDVTERNRAEEALQRAQQELRRYSQDLERQVRKRTQEVTSILKYTPAVVSIKDREGRYNLVNSRFEELFAMRIEGVRGMAIRLRPDVLDTLGLVDALEWVTSDFERRTSITCFFQHRPVPNIKDTLSTAAYRITQEALTNVARHARASRVDVSLGAEDGVLTLIVSDDG